MQGDKALGTKPFGLVVVPVVLGEKETAREAGRNKKYQGLIKILKKLRKMDPSLDLALSTERGERKRKKKEEGRRRGGGGKRLFPGGPRGGAG